mgnify:CR=1 FL=1
MCAGRGRGRYANQSRRSYTLEPQELQSVLEDHGGGTRFDLIAYLVQQTAENAKL